MIAAAGAPRFSSGILADIFWGHQLALMWDELVSPLLVPHWEMAEGPRVLPVAGTPGIGLVLKGLVPPSTPAQSLPPRTAQPATPQPPTLADFASLIYTAMARTAALHSPAFERAARWISGYKFFEGIVRREGLQQSLDGLSRRLSGAQKLSGSLKILDAQGDSLLLALRDFWPQVVALARESALAESLALDLLPTGIAEDKA